LTEAFPKDMNTFYLG